MAKAKKKTSKRHSNPASVRSLERYSKSELEQRPTIAEGHTDNLKAEDEVRGVPTRWWLSRMTVEDGETDAVHVEQLLGGRWQEVHAYGEPDSYEERYGNPLTVKKGKMFGKPAWLVVHPEDQHVMGYRRSKKEAQRLADRLLYPEQVDLREIKKMEGPFTLLDEGEENIYFTDGEGQKFFFKHEGSEARRSGFFKAIGVTPVAVGGYDYNPDCPRGQIWRDGYHREGYRRSDGTYVEPTYVEGGCITDRGAPGEGPDVIDIEDEGDLGGPGYTEKSAKERHRLLRRCVKRKGYRSCLGKLQALAVLGKRTWPKKKLKVVERDRRWLVKEFGGPGSFGPEGNPGIFGQDTRYLVEYLPFFGVRHPRTGEYFGGEWGFLETFFSSRLAAQEEFDLLARSGRFEVVNLYEIKPTATGGWSKELIDEFPPRESNSSRGNPMEYSYDGPIFFPDARVSPSDEYVYAPTKGFGASWVAVGRHGDPVGWVSLEDFSDVKFDTVEVVDTLNDRIVQDIRVDDEPIETFREMIVKYGERHDQYVVQGVSRDGDVVVDNQGGDGGWIRFLRGRNPTKKTSKLARRLTVK